MTTGRNKAKELSNKGTNKIRLERERRAFHFANEASFCMNNIQIFLHRVAGIFKYRLSLTLKKKKKQILLIENPYSGITYSH